MIGNSEVEIWRAAAATTADIIATATIGEPFTVPKGAHLIIQAIDLGAFLDNLRSVEDLHLTDFLNEAGR